MCLEGILIKHFGIKKAFLKRKRITGYFCGGDEPDEPVYSYGTIAGHKAYAKLTSLLYDLELLLGKGFDANKWISELDDIFEGEVY